MVQAAHLWVLRRSEAPPRWLLPREPAPVLSEAPIRVVYIDNVVALSTSVVASAADAAEMQPTLRGQGLITH